ncbi:MAG: RluA family pseudouridine synthase [Lachnospiraceae bacterium]|nr:RluA family pseudouridine synthase [Lachnospiraceae bacterium]
MQNLTITQEESGQRLDKYLKRILPEAGTSFLYKMLRKKNITLNGKKADGSEKINAGDRIEVFFSDETFMKFRGMAGMPGENDGISSAAAPTHELSGKMSKAEGSKTSDKKADNLKRENELIPEYENAFRKLKNQIEIIYEDEHILLTNKPAGILVQKSDPGDLTLNEWFVGYLLEKGEINAVMLSYYTPSICNRLDRNTAGIVICAKTLPASRMAAELLRERKLRKYYHLAVAGRVDQGGIIEGYLSKDSKANTVTLYESEKPGTAYTKTVYEPVRKGKGSVPYTVLEAELITGKTHQLRAHFAWIGHPIIGDPKYGDQKVNAEFRSRGIKSQCLTCCRVEFPELTGIFSYLSGRKFSVEETWNL